MEQAKKKSLRKNLVSAAIGLIVMIALFWFIGRNASEYSEALTDLQRIDGLWIGVIALASIFNILIYPLTAIAAIRTLSYFHASVSRQAGFTLSNIIPGGGAVAVATQYTVLARYGVPQARAAAAVSADAIFTYLFTLGAPSLAVLLLVLEGRSTAAYITTAGIGLGVVIVSLIVISAVLRSESSARRIGDALHKPAGKVFGWIKKPPPNVTAMLVTFHEQASDLIRSRWKSLSVTNIGAQMAPMLVLWAALIGLGATESDISVIEIFAAFSIALVLTSFPITPGGLGTVDAALIALLIAFGVDNSTAVAADILWRAGWFLPQLLVGSGFLAKYWWDGRSINRLHSQGDTETTA